MTAMKKNPSKLSSIKQWKMSQLTIKHWIKARRLFHVIFMSALLCYYCCCCNAIEANQFESISSIGESPASASLAQELHHSEASSSSNSKPSNHRMESTSADDQRSKKLRSGRQYDGPISTSSSSGSYSAISGDGAAYVGQMPLTGSANSGYSSPTGYSMSDLAGAYQAATGASSGQLSGAYHHADPLASMLARNYNPIGMSPSSMHHSYPPPPGYPTNAFGPTPGGGLASMFSPIAGGSGMFPLMSKGFDVSEIICTAIAVAIGAVIVGAPFILIYLFIMNQMNGNGGGPNGLGPSGGAISLTGPTSSTTVNGRKKRHTSFPEALFKQLSPLVNNEQVAQTFKVFVNSLAKYQM